MFGYMGKILRIHLSTGQICQEALQDSDTKNYLGGSGLGAKYLFAETDADTDPFGPDNLLIFMTGPFCGTMVPTSGRHAVVTKSPLTGIFAEADVGGSWGHAFKGTGYDGLIIKGKAEKPVYILITEDRVEIHDAHELWSVDTIETYHKLRRKYGKKAEVQCIGIGGERLVRYAAIMTEGEDGRALGRCGSGAVMGSKNLKAVVVKGNKKAKISDGDALRESIKSLAPSIKESVAGMTKYGTASGVTVHESYGNFPLKNWALGRWPEGVANISGQRMADTILTGNYYCQGCIIGCGRKVKIGAGPYKGVEGAGPEYETLGTLGGMCLIDDLEAISYANELCNRFGIDTISTGASIAFAMEAYEKGLLTEEQTNGLKLEFGNALAMVEMVKQIGEREGLGIVLGEGVRRAAEFIQKGAEEFSCHVKGLELPAHDPRALHGVALSYATSNRGGCHLAGFTHPFERVRTIPELGYDKPHDRHQTEGKGEFVAVMQNLMGVCDSIKICKFVLNGLSLTGLVQWINYVTGWETTIDEVMKTGERIYNLKRLYNTGCGITRADDNLPPRFLHEERTGEDLLVKMPPLEIMLNEYYSCRGWDINGIPTRAKLRELGLNKLK